MTTSTIPMIGASSAYSMEWSAINWQTVKSHVRRLQMRIAKAIREKRYGKAKALQWLLTHSFYAKLLAVKRTTENRGGQDRRARRYCLENATTENASRQIT